MLKYILEKKFLVSWLTLVVCLLGILTYFKMPVELLPESDLSRIAVVLPNPGIDSRSFVTYLEDTIIEAAQRSNIKYSPKIEVNSKRIIFDFKSEKTSIDKISIFKKNIQSELKIKDIHLPFEVFDIGTHQSPVMTIMIFKKELKNFQIW